jgi:hypothetical protein
MLSRLDKEVACARVLTMWYFDGLCINFMAWNRSPKHDDIDADYRRQLESVDGRWDAHRWAKHDDPTWYVSWRRRDEHNQKFLERYRKMVQF